MFMARQPEMCRILGLVVLVLLFAANTSASPTVTVDWSQPTTVSKTTTTLQVVVNPMLSDTVPIRDKLFDTLAFLEADMVRFVPWFPYPLRGVAELSPPTETETSWNFTWIRPQLERFMNATYGKGHTTLINFSTQPSWMYNTTTWNNYPRDPNAVDFSYAAGNPIIENIPIVAQYYGRLLSWLMKGGFTDELGKVHTDGYHYDLTHWEVFNEAEHGYDVQTYTLTYDAVVKEIRKQADPEHKIQFVGIGGANPDWIPYFLNKSNHEDPDVPLDWISLHFYASCSSRTDPESFEQFFPDADGFIANMVNTYIPQRDALSPSTKFDLDELGVILPDDNTPGAPDPSEIYWNAAGAMYAYIFAKLAPAGVETLGHSQLCGSPAIPQWDIPDPQYPSVSLTNWTTGQGNARYWVLKLLIDHFAAGDQFVQTQSSNGPVSYSNPFCGETALGQYSDMVLWCPNGTISALDFAAFGTPNGACGDFSVNSACNSSDYFAYASKACVGQRQCSLEPLAEGDPCVGTLKQLKVQARCSSGEGAATPNGKESGFDIYGLGAISASGDKKVLLINKKHTAATIDLDSSVASSSPVMYVVDEATGWGPPRKEPVQSLNAISLAPYAVAVVYV